LSGRRGTARPDPSAAAPSAGSAAGAAAPLAGQAGKVLLVSVKAKPLSQRSALEPAADGTFIAHLKSPPVDGRANEELIGLVAARFGVRRADVVLRRGGSGRLKVLEVRAGR
jgi:uncharacterized protein YggU (UPF0235/DUF167 family)